MRYACPMHGPLNWHTFCMQESVLDAGECSGGKRVLLLRFVCA